MQRNLSATLDGVPIISCELHHRAGPSASTLVARMATLDAVRISKGPRLALSDGVEKLEATSFVLEREVAGSDGTTTLRYRLEGEELSASLIATALAKGESLYRNLDGDVERVASGRSLPNPRETTLRLEAAKVERPSELRAMATQAIEFHDLPDEWEPVVSKEEGRWWALSDALDELNIDEAIFRDVILHPEDLASTLAIDAEEAAILEREAYRVFRFVGELPEGDVFALRAASTDAFDHQPDAEDGTIDAKGEMRSCGATLIGMDEAGQPIVALDHRAIHLESKGGDDRFTLHGFRVDGQAALEITLAMRVEEASTITTLDLGGEGSSLELAFDGIPAWPDDSLEAERLREKADAILAKYREAMPSELYSTEYATALRIAPDAFHDVVYRCDDSGLRTFVKARSDWQQSLSELFSIEAETWADTRIVWDIAPDMPAPRNNARSGPLVIRDDANDDQHEAASFASLSEADPDTGALTLENFGRLAQPFWLDGAGDDDRGAWFLAAPMKLIDEGVVLLEDRLTMSAEKAVIDKSIQLGDETPLPKGSDGVVLQGLDGETMLGLFDRSLVAEQRGSGRYSTSIREITGHWLDPEREGALNLLTLVTFSPQALKELSGRGLPAAWVPALNFLDAKTSTPRAAAKLGRGRFAEGSGREIGQLAHLPNQHGPLMADATTCEKHRIGEANHSEGVFRECAGHLSTEAFFKAPGDGAFDAPFLFQRETSEVSPAGGREYRAEIKFNPKLMHKFDGQDVTGRWVVTYRMPVWDGRPPFWRPAEDPPYVFERNLHAPSHDWVPPWEKEPPEGDSETPEDYVPPQEGEEEDPDDPRDWNGVAHEELDVAYPGPVLSSTGYAVRDEMGAPTPALGGGVAFTPGGVLLRDGLDLAYEGTRRWMVLHPQVGFGFGLPNDDDDGAPREGVRFWLEDSTLNLASADANGEADESFVFEVDVPLNAKRGFAGFAPTVSGSRSDGSALANLLAALADRGLIIDSSVA